MKAMREIRPPGVYPAPGELRAGPIGAADTRIAGFVGLAHKGPLDEPRRLTSWNDLVDTYGGHGGAQYNDGFLARSVEGFFANGGPACYVVRVAHRPRPGDAEGAEHAAAAERVVVDGWGKPTLRVRALDEGRWGNAIWVRFTQSASAKTLLTLDLDVGSGEARVNSARGFERGALVRIFDRENSDYVILTEVDDRTLRWAAATPIVRRYRAAGPTWLEVLDFEVQAHLRDRREAFRGLQLSPLSRNYVARAINESSQLIRVDDLRSSSPPPYHLPVSAPAAKLAGGRDGSDDVTAEDFVGFDHGPAERRGLMALCAVEEVAMLAVPDAMLGYQRHPGPQADLEAQRIQDAMVDACENLEDRVAILDLPPTRDVELARRWRRRIDSSYAAFYFPWLTLADGTRVPPSGFVAGVYARCDGREGSHKAPANEPITNVAGVTLALLDDDLGRLNAEGVNALRAFPGRGLRVWGARTASDDPSWRYVNVRRLFVMLRRSIAQGTQWACFEPNDPRLWENMTREVSFFLEAQWKKGAFAGEAREEAFFVKCDAENNPAETRDAGQLIIEVGVAPALPSEFILFEVTQKMGDRETTE
jgi:hypothetical protein